jgi:hypothetical protein
MGSGLVVGSYLSSVISSAIHCETGTACVHAQRPIYLVTDTAVVSDPERGDIVCSKTDDQA